MKIVVDTNVIISGVFFGGAPQRVLNAIVSSKVTACATTEIVDEYLEIVDEMIARKPHPICYSTEYCNKWGAVIFKRNLAPFLRDLKTLISETVCLMLS